MELKRGLAKVAFVLGFLGLFRILLGGVPGSNAYSVIIPLLFMTPYLSMRFGGDDGSDSDNADGEEKMADTRDFPYQDADDGEEVAT